ncbi:hypothetical protein QFC19_009174 [Naganishia cerealis]|uniref:Uncharacterized protein n=1 Tax=Naganishia cerealis TaxID=610337 RepID=A0ACC2UWE8_9TREE|nr:hypothetical protein QFC19_009174 [Naganishia cerealis]
MNRPRTQPGAPDRARGANQAALLQTTKTVFGPYNLPLPAATTDTALHPRSRQHPLVRCSTPVSSTCADSMLPSRPVVSDVTEEQLTSIFSEVGPVQEFVLKFDQNTGKPKGFGFCHYFDHETALSAVRNLQEVVVNGRNLRVELSTDEPFKPRTGGAGGNRPAAGGRSGAPGQGQGQGQFAGDQGFPPPPPGMGGMNNGPDMGFGGMRPVVPGFGGNPSGGGGFTPPPASNAFPSRPPGPPAAQGINLGLLPPGQDVPQGMKATDVISKTLASIPPGKLEEVLTGMKTLVQTSPDQARTVLNAHPQLAYALFQAMLLMNVVDPAVLSRIQPIPSAHAPPQPTAPTYRPAQPVHTYAPQPPPSSNPHSSAQPPLAQLPPPSMPPFAPTVRPGPGPGPNSVPQPPPQAQGYAGSPYQQQQQGPPPGNVAPPPGNVAPPGLAPPSGAGNAQAIATALNMVSPDQRQMLMQVFQLTHEQIQALPPDQRAGVVQLRAQFGIE